MTIAPLQWPEEFYVEQSQQDSALMRLPLVGWLLAALLPAKGPSPGYVIEKVKEQLVAREKPDPGVWGADSRRIEVGHFLCTVAKEHSSWPNNHFMPADPFDIAFLIPWDDCRIVEAILRIEERLGIHLEDHEVEQWCGKTLGEVADYLLQKQKRQTTSQAA